MPDSRPEPDPRPANVAPLPDLADAPVRSAPVADPDAADDGAPPAEDLTLPPEG